MIELVLDAPNRDLGGFTVRRALPSARRRSVGPFVFFDHFGPVALSPDTRIDVRPHPHIGLATITWLWEGEFVHRDTLGSVQSIKPGAVNWMVAGRGIAHSERAPEAGTPPRMHGLQVWLALPVADEEMEPLFEHHPAATLPRVDVDGVPVHILAGTAYGARSPVGIRSPTLYAEATLARGQSLAMPDHEERGLYVVTGAVQVDGTAFQAGQMVIFAEGGAPVVTSADGAQIALLGGERLPEPRYLWWNFVSSRPDRVEHAAAEWRAGRFPAIPGDDREFIPAPEIGPRFAIDRSQS